MSDPVDALATPEERPSLSCPSCQHPTEWHTSGGRCRQRDAEGERCSCGLEPRRSAPTRASWRCRLGWHDWRFYLIPSAFSNAWVCARCKKIEGVGRG